jgi:hypothetical protein
VSRSTRLTPPVFSQAAMPKAENRMISVVARTWFLVDRH